MKPRKLLAVLLLAGFWLLAPPSLSMAEEINLPDFADTSDITLNGTDSIKFVDNKLRLTEAENDQGTSAWNSTEVDITNGFTATFEVTIDPGVIDPPTNAGGADGFFYVIQAAPPADTTLVGNVGGARGYRTNNGGLPNTVGIHYNTWTTSQMSIEAADANQALTILEAPITADAGNVYWNEPRTFTGYVYYDHANEVLYAEIPGFSSDGGVATEINLVDRFGTDSVIFGFTAGTGGANQIHDVNSWTVEENSQMPDPLLYIDSSDRTLEFGRIPGAKTMALSIKNHGSSEDLVIDDTSGISGEDAAFYSHDATLPLTIPAGGEANINITVDPQGTTGLLDAALTLSSNDGRDSVDDIVVNLRTNHVPLVTEISYDNFEADPLDINLVGAAVQTGSEIDLVTSENGQAGAAWVPDLFDISNGFTANFDFHIDTHNGGADGFTFVIQEGAYANETALGFGGGEQGVFFGGGPRNAIVVEYDTWRKSSIQVWYVQPGGARVPLTADLVSPAGEAFFLATDDRSSEVIYSSKLELLVINVPGLFDEPIIVNVDIDGLLGSDTALFGFTAGTGGANQTVSIHNLNVVPGADFGNPAIYVSDPSIEFGLIAPDGSATSSVTIQNVGATQDLIISDATAITGAGAGKFAIVTDLPLTIPADSSADLEVTFLPDNEVGSYLATLTLENNSEDPDLQAIGVSLSGNALTTVESGISYSGFADAENLNLVGQSVINGDILDVTVAAGNQGGAAWNTQVLDISNGFVTEFEFNLTEVTNTGADGFGFIVQSAESGSVNALGASGGARGYFTNPGALPNTVAVLFNTWNNSQIQAFAANDAGTERQLVTPVTSPAADDFFNAPDMRTARIEYDHETTTLTAWVSDFGAGPLVADVDLVAELGSNQAIFGFAGGTGGAWQNHRVHSWYLDVDEEGEGFSIDDFSQVDVQLNGTDSIGIDGTDLRLTEAANGQGTSAWLEERINLLNGFTATYEFTIDPGDVDPDTNVGADGIFFALQADPPANRTLLGDGGGERGFFTEGGAGAIPNAVGVHYNTWTTSQISFNGGTSTGARLNLSEILTADNGRVFFNTPGTYTATVHYDHVNEILYTEIPGFAKGGGLAANVNLVDILGSDTAIAGFTAGTGGANQLQVVHSVGITEEPLAGPVPYVNLASRDVNFGAVSTPGTESVTVSNLGTSEDLVITDASAITGDGSEFFSIETALPITIGPGGSADIALGFDPAGASGQYNVELTLQSNAGSPVVLDLLGLALTGTTTIAFDDFTDSTGLNLLGSAVIGGDTANELDLTTSANNQAGATWYDQLFDISGGFTSTFGLHIDGVNNTGADGFAFVLQGASHATLDRLGNTGGAQGAFGGNGPRDAIVIEFDTWEKSVLQVWYITPDQQNIALTPQLFSPAGDAFFNDPAPREATVTWDSEQNLLQVYVPGLLAEPLLLAVDITDMLGDDEVLMGFTAGTGGANQTVTIENWSVTAGADFGDPRLVADTDLAIFDATSPDGSTTTSITVTNIGGGDLTIADTSAVSGPGVFTLLTDLPVTVPALGSTTLEVQFTPGDGFGTFNGTLTLDNNSEIPELQTQTVALHGNSLNFDDSSFGFSSFAGNDNFRLLGSAHADGSELHLTDAVNSQAGAAWSETALTVSEGFTAVLDFSIEEINSTGADGFGIVLQNANNGSLSALGASGGSRGYFGGGPALNNSVAVLFNTWNSSQIQLIRTDANGATSDIVGAVTSPEEDAFFNNPALRTVIVNYDHATTTLTVNIPGFGAGPLVANVDLVAELGSSEAIFGLTAGTGGANQIHSIDNLFVLSRVPPTGTTQVVIPDGINFGEVSLLEGPISHPIRVFNLSPDSPVDTVVNASGDDVGLFEIGDPGPVPPQDALDVMVTFDPSAVDGPGTYTATVAVANAVFGGVTTTVPISVTVVDVVPQSWYDAFGFSGDDAAPDADPDGDLLNNFTEYAFGLDPTAHDADQHSGLSVEAGFDGTFLTLTYIRRTDDPALTYTVQSSTSLEAGWQDGANIQEVSAVDLGNGTEQVTVRYNTDVNSVDIPENVFLRVVATK